ncbi:MAG: hypothetical protein PUK59_02640 [Actinomycetaceae bacterium]|nr:hypothetical protein [Actinomycetaceae bacterium]
MDKQDHERIITAIDFWVKTKLEQQQYSQASGHAQGGTRAAVTGGKHKVGINQLILDELQELCLTGVTHYTDRKATCPAITEHQNRGICSCCVMRSQCSQSNTNQ